MMLQTHGMGLSGAFCAWLQSNMEPSLYPAFLNLRCARSTAIDIGGTAFRGQTLVCRTYAFRDNEI
jgi:hypothetical protein